MQRRKFLVGLGGATIGGATLVGTGAFSRIEAQRSVTIQVAEDPDAYLGLDKCDTPNGSYAHLDDDGHLRIYMDDENPTIGDSDLGDGINSNSTTWFHNVFQICNQGKEDVCVHIADDEDWPEVDEGEHEGERRVEFYLGDDEDASIIGEDNAILLPLGECVCIGIRTYSYGLSDGDELLDDLENEISIIADVDGDCIPDEPITESGRLSLAYEDLPEEDSDWDYNDWVVDLFGTFVPCDENGGVESFAMDIVPQSRRAGDSHTFEFEFDCGGEYDVWYYDENGTKVESDNDSFTAGTVAITVWDDTSTVLDNLNDGECVLPSEWARLEVTFDECCDIDTIGGEFEVHGDDLPFNAILENNDESGVTVERGDDRLLVVNEGWNWPEEGTPIWDAYGDVTEDNGEPSFAEDWEDSEDPNETVDCNITVNNDNSLSTN